MLKAAYRFFAVLLLAAGSGPAYADVEFLRLTCIEGTRYLAVEYVSMPDDAVDGAGSDAADGTALEEWRKEQRPIWSRNGFHSPDKLRYTCKLGNSTYEVTGSRRNQWNTRNCDVGPIEISLKSPDYTYVDKLRMGPGCNGYQEESPIPGVRAIRLWNEFGGSSPALMHFCLTKASDDVGCLDYRPHPARPVTNPPVTQPEWDNFLRLRQASTTRKAVAQGEFVRPTSDLTMYMFIRYPCAFPGLSLPEDAVIYAVGGGKFRELPFRIDQRQHSYITDLPVNAPGKKVALLIRGYGSSVWNISWTPGTEIVAVAAVSGSRQAFAGLPPNVPTFNSYFGSGHACRQQEIPDFGFTGLRQRDRDQLDAMSLKLYGRPVNEIFGGSLNPIVVGEPLISSSDLIQSPATPPESFKTNR